MARKIPEFSLPDGRGGSGGSERLFQRQDMLVALVHGRGCQECEGFLDELGRAAGEGLSGASPVVVALDGAAADGSNRPVPLLADPSGHAPRRLAEELGIPAGEAVIAPADRFGVVYAVRPIHGTDPRAELTDAVDWIAFSQMQCPECNGTPTW